MALYLSPYIGQGTRDDPFRPSGADQSGASAIDLRIDCTRADGGGIKFALLWLPGGIPNPTGAIKLADDHGEIVSALIKNAATTRFRLDFSKDLTIQDVVETILLRPDNGHWHRLRPSNGRVEAWLGSGAGHRRWVDFPVVAGGATALDDFNRADENPLAGNWTSVSANPFRLISNQVQGSGVSFVESYAYWNATPFGNDQFSQLQIVTANFSLGVTVRGSGAPTDYYCTQFYPSNSADLFKYVSGSYTSLAGGAYAWTTNDYIRMTAVGSTLTFYADASNPPTTQILQVTDTTFSSGKVGIYDWNGVAVLDNWSGGDLSAADTMFAAAVTLSIVTGAPLSTQIALAGGVTVRLTVAPTLSTAITMASAVTCSITTVAPLTTAISMAAVATLTITAASALDTAIAYAGTVVLAIDIAGGLAVATYPTRGIATRLNAALAETRLDATVQSRSRSR